MNKIQVTLIAIIISFIEMVDSCCGMGLPGSGIFYQSIDSCKEKMYPINKEKTIFTYLLNESQRSMESFHNKIMINNLFARTSVACIAEYNEMPEYIPIFTFVTEKAEITNLIFVYPNSPAENDKFYNELLKGTLITQDEKEDCNIYVIQYSYGVTKELKFFLRYPDPKKFCQGRNSFGKIDIKYNILKLCEDDFSVIAPKNDTKIVEIIAKTFNQFEEKTEK